jgi:hypothetical protein
MSTKSTIICTEDIGKARHKLDFHVFTEMHEPGMVIFDIGCSTCNCTYKFSMVEHLGEQFAKLLKEGLKK